LNISLGGVALKTDKGLNVGREYLIKLEYKGESIDIKGTIVFRCELSNIEEGGGWRKCLDILGRYNV